MALCVLSVLWLFLSRSLCLIESRIKIVPAANELLHISFVWELHILSECHFCMNNIIKTAHQRTACHFHRIVDILIFLVINWIVNKPPVQYALDAAALQHNIQFFYSILLGWLVLVCVYVLYNFSKFVCTPINGSDSRIFCPTRRLTIIRFQFVSCFCDRLFVAFVFPLTSAQQRGHRRLWSCIVIHIFFLAQRLVNVRRVCLHCVRMCVCAYLKRQMWTNVKNKSKKLRNFSRSKISSDEERIERRSRMKSTHITQYKNCLIITHEKWMFAKNKMRCM